MLNSWIADAEVYYEGSLDDLIDYYLEIFYSFMSPSLTPEGYELFTKYYKMSNLTLPEGGL